MIRLLNRYFPRRTVLLTLTEALLVAACFVLAVFLTAGSSTAAKEYLLFEDGAGRIGLVVLIFLVLMFYFDLYNTAIFTNRREVVTRLVGVLGMTFVSLAVVYYSFPDASLGGMVLWIGMLSVAVTVPVWRLLFFAVNRSARFAERALIYGDGPLAAPLIDAIARRVELGLRVAGYVGTNPDISGVPKVGGGNVAEFVTREGIGRIIVTMGDRRGKLDIGELLQLKASGVRIQDGPEYYETVTGKIPTESLRLRWLLFARGFHVRPALRAYKRIFSLLFGTIGVVLSSPVLLLTALAIRITSNGPVLDRDTRVGEFGAPFTAYRFRTTSHPTGKSATISTQPADPEIGSTLVPGSDTEFTPVGKWLRLTHLDELPLLLNIIKGNLSFIGPRPISPGEQALCEAAIPYYKERCLIKPGATGWSQINRPQRGSIEDQKDILAYDLFYIKNVSLGLDLYIVISTLRMVLLGRPSR